MESMYGFNPAIRSQNKRFSITASNRTNSEAFPDGFR